MTHHQLHQVYASVFATDAGRAVLEDLRRRGYMDDAMYQPGDSSTALDLVFREGRRSLVLHIIYMLDARNFDHGNQNMEVNFE